MFILRRFARPLTAALIALLFFGTLMPGSWKDAGARPFPFAGELPMLAHIVLFAAICSMVPLARFWTVKFWHVPAFGLLLALLTEGLQFFAIDRHPNLAGIAQDMAGAFMGWAIGRRLLAASAAEEVSSPSAAFAPPGGPPSGGSTPVRASRPSDR